MVKMAEALTWGELASLYDKYHGGRRARTLLMETVADWAKKATDIFDVSEEGSFYEKKDKQDA